MKIIMYHYVREDSEEFPYFRHLYIGDFRKQLDYLGKEFGFVKKEDFLNVFEGGRLPEGVVLTFDDGLKDQYDYVLPELSKRNLWGIFYVNHEAQKRKTLLTPHRIHVLLGKFKGRDIFAHLKVAMPQKMIVKEYQEKFENETYMGFTDEAAAIATKRILNYYLPDHYREMVLDQLMESFRLNERGIVKNYYLSDAEIKEMADKGMIIGAHTVNHLVMSNLSRADQEKEIIPCFEYLKGILGGNNPLTYCHPYGGFLSFDEATVDILNELHCLFSLNVEARDVDSKDIKYHRQALPRYDCNLFPFGQIRFLQPPLGGSHEQDRYKKPYC